MSGGSYAPAEQTENVAMFLLCLKKSIPEEVAKAMLDEHQIPYRGLHSPYFQEVARSYLFGVSEAQRTEALKRLAELSQTDKRIDYIGRVNEINTGFNFSVAIVGSAEPA